MLNIDKSPQPLLEYFMHRNSTRSQTIYIVVLLAVIVVVALLPVIKVTISVQGAGIIRTVSEKTEVKSLASGMVEQVFVHENQIFLKSNQVCYESTLLYFLHFSSKLLH